MGRKPCDFCGGEADTYGVHVSCFKCGDKALSLYKKRIKMRKRRHALAEGVASIMRIEAGSNVDKPHAISVNSMQSDTDEKRFKQTTLNDFVPSFPPLKKGSAVQAIRLQR